MKQRSGLDSASKFRDLMEKPAWEIMVGAYLLNGVMPPATNAEKQALGEAVGKAVATRDRVLWAIKIGEIKDSHWHCQPSSGAIFINRKEYIQWWTKDLGKTLPDELRKKPKRRRAKSERALEQEEKWKAAKRETVRYFSDRPEARPKIITREVRNRLKKLGFNIPETDRTIWDNIKGVLPKWERGAPARPNNSRHNSI